MKHLLPIVVFFIVANCFGQPFVTGIGVYEVSSPTGGGRIHDGTTVTYELIRSCGLHEVKLWTSNSSVFSSYIVDFGDGKSFSGAMVSLKDIMISHSYEKPERYNLSINISGSGDTGSFGKDFQEYVGGAAPILIPNQSLVQCDVDNDGIGNFNLKEIFNEIVDKTDPNLYEDEYYGMSFYESIEAIQKSDSISTLTPYQNKNSEPKELFVKMYIKNVENGYCFSVMNFSISSANLSLGAIDAMIACDGSNGINDDNIGGFDLGTKENDIRSQFALPANTSVNFYPTEFDAEFENNLIEGTQFISGPTTIWVRAEDENFDCIGVEPLSLDVSEFPFASNLSNEYFICLNHLPDSAIKIDAGSYYEAYEWRDGNNDIFSTDTSVSISEPGNYTLTTYLTQNGIQCPKLEEFSVVASNIATIETIEVIEGTQNNSIAVITSGEGTYEYQLINDITNLVYRPYQSSNTFENVHPGLYKVYVKDIKNDCGILDDKVSVIGFPKFLTPNNDGYHDTWQVYGVSGMFHPNAIIRIFDRYGKLLKELSPLGKGWDGSIDGQKLPSDDYWFSVTLQDARVFKGHFTLKQ